MDKKQIQRLNKIIDDFVNLYNNGMAQRDEKWMKLIQITFGGSEIASIQGDNHWCPKINLVGMKCGIVQRDNPNLNTTWGQFFEDVSAIFINQYFLTEVKGDEMCITVHDGHSNSPDGIIVIHRYKDEKGRWELLTKDTEIDDETQIIHEIAMLEFKNPPIRKLSIKQVPHHYFGQIQSGLSTVEIADFALFVDSTFCICKLDQLKYNDKFNHDLHHYAVHRDIIGKSPISIGFSIVYAKDKVKIKGELENVSVDGVILQDIGSLNDTEGLPIVDLISKVQSKAVDVIHSKHYFTGEMENKKDEIRDVIGQVPVGHHPIAIVPWKLFDCNIIPVERDREFITQMFKDIDETIADIRKIKDAPDVGKAYEEYCDENREPVDEVDKIDYAKMLGLG
ncbi:Uncharacterised protein [uncultured archaeon]|nr:Uncharacterised protein [uncultured archaeon]